MSLSAFLLVCVRAEGVFTCNVSYRASILFMSRPSLCHHLLFPPATKTAATSMLNRQILTTCWLQLDRVLLFFLVVGFQQTKSTAAEGHK